jgi:hypothetical protein
LLRPHSFLIDILHVPFKGARETVKALTAAGSNVVAPVTADEFKAKFEREYAELEKLIRTIRKGSRERTAGARRGRLTPAR